MHIFCGRESRGDWRSEKNMLIILDIINITQVTGGGVTLIPCRCFKTGVETKSETSCSDITRRQIEKHVFGKDVRQMSDQSPLCRKSTPSVISSAITVHCALSDACRNKVPNSPIVSL